MKLALGTVAFGLDYGISNNEGKTPTEEVHRILEYAHTSGINTLDTAAAYGSSEEVLGRYSDLSQFNIVTKVFPDNADFLDTDTLTSQFKRSLERLKIESVYALLLHRTDDLIKSPARNEIIKALNSLKMKGLVKKIGVSAYDPNELTEITNSFSLDLVQIPGNILDQRFWKSGCVSALRKQGIEIHVRSSFLQGLLLMTPETLPPTLRHAHPWLQSVQNEARQQGLSQLELCLSYMKSIELDKIVVGTNTLTQLKEIVSSYNKVPEMLHSEKFICEDESVTNPAKWKKG